MQSKISIIWGTLVLLAVASCAPRDPGAQQAASGGDAATAGAPAANALERGKYLVTLGACNECHTPFTMGPQGPMPDMSKMLSGHPAELVLSDPPAATNDWVTMGNATNTAFAGPWGISYAPNLTPHETGLGVWTEEMFIKAIREGKHMGAGRPILPPMPWTAYSQMTDDDLRAVFAYLKTIPPIDNAAPQAKVNPPPAMTASGG